MELTKAERPMLKAGYNAARDQNISTDNDISHNSGSINTGTENNKGIVGEGIVNNGDVAGDILSPGSVTIYIILNISNDSKLKRNSKPTGNDTD